MRKKKKLNANEELNENVGGEKGGKTGNSDKDRGAGLKTQESPCLGEKKKKLLSQHGPNAGWTYPITEG